MYPEGEFYERFRTQHPEVMSDCELVLRGAAGHQITKRDIVCAVKEAIPSAAVGDNLLDPAFKVKNGKDSKFFRVEFERATDASKLKDFAAFRVKGWVPLIEYKAKLSLSSFKRLRPYFVRNTTAAACVCEKCLRFKLKVEGLLEFKHWRECNADVAELAEEAIREAGQFSPSAHSFLRACLCPRDVETGYFAKKCSYGACHNCGWTQHVTG